MASPFQWPTWANTKENFNDIIGAPFMEYIGRPAAANVGTASRGAQNMLNSAYGYLDSPATPIPNARFSIAQPPDDSTGTSAGADYGSPLLEELGLRKRGAMKARPLLPSGSGGDY